MQAEPLRKLGLEGSAKPCQEPLLHSVAARSIEGEMKLGAAEEEVLCRHGVLDLRRIVKLGAGHAGSDLFG